MGVLTLLENELQRFYVFVDNNPALKSQILSLKEAQITENKLHSFIAANQHGFVDKSSTASNTNGFSFSSTNEEGAMEAGKYITSMSSVDLSSSKSLLNRYAMSVPLEPNCRTSKEATTLHMPVYEENTLILPAHMPPAIRKVELPILFRGEAKKKNQQILALAACVRLHKLGLLNDRLLPLSTSDMEQWLLEKALMRLPSCKRQRPMSVGAPHKVYVYGICPSGDSFKQEERELLHKQQSGAVRLAYISFSLLPENLPVYSFKHTELGLIVSQLTYCGKLDISTPEWKELTDFHCIVFNSRWRRKKTKQFFFDERLLTNQGQVIPPYIIGCLTIDGSIDWKLIRETMREFSRSLDAREEAARTGSLVRPRIWSPSRYPGVPYIVYGPSGWKCSEPFPGEDYTSFKDYYAKKHGLQINPDGELFLAKRLWDFPRAIQSKLSIDEDTKDIPMVELPAEVFAEAPVANPILLLHSIVLPQFLVSCCFSCHINYFTVMGDRFVPPDMF